MRTNIDLDEFLPIMDTPDKVYQLFSSLGFNVLDAHLKTNPSVYNLPAKEAALVEKIYAVSNYDRRFQILLFKLKEENKEAIRTIPEKILREVDFPFIIFTPDFKTYTFTLVEKVREGPGEFKRKLTRLSVDRDYAYYTDKEIISNFFLQDEINNPKEIYKVIQDAMSVERVTKKFFTEYKEVFFAIKTNFTKQINDTRMAHDFTQQLMNRIMFLYFIAKKRWVGDDINFLKKFWNSYQEKKQTENSFYTEWLSVLFFEAFNNKFFPKSYFPKELNSTLQLSPYLNGGLFTEQRLDSIGIKVSDNDFLRIYNFFNRYNFTIREDLPLEEEVAVDPEMIGKVYESLVNLSEASDERGDAGIFYTPRAEIDFMCRLSLVEYLDHHLAPTPSKDYIYKLVFAKTEDEVNEAINHLKITYVWPNLFEDSLDNLTVVDPAVGSGSFLVGMLNVLTELYKLVYKDIGRKIDDFEIKKQIIGRSLYGVDVMEWAVHVCELRLWLQLVVEADIPLAERKTSPLLPNLTFKIRPGDSLVEEVGGVNLSMGDRGALNLVIKRKITMLKQAKYDYFYNNRSSKFYQSEEMLKQEEQLIFQMIIDERIMQIRNETSSLGNHRKQETLALPGMEIKRDQEQKDLFEEGNKKIKEIKESEIELLVEMRKNIKTKKPFVWDIDFVEIFADENEEGFDIVIGNPPYVRQEKIADPKIPKDKVNIENKKEYKEKLTKSVEAHFPWVKNLDKKSDLYIYFFFHALSLLNPTGTLCFITSNSWLDVGYGADLQEFLLKYAPIKAIFDNQAKRSFESADVNTVITLLGSPIKQENTFSNDKVKFVMFKKPFEEVINTKNLLALEETIQIISNNDFRVYPISQYELLKDGWEYPENIDGSQIEAFDLSIGSYAGNKWGGKYLRAPDIFFVILKKGGVLTNASRDEESATERERERERESKVHTSQNSSGGTSWFHNRSQRILLSGGYNRQPKLVRLGDIANVRFGIKTGANEFFYVEEMTEIMKFEELKNKIKNLGNLKSLQDIKNMGLCIVKNTKTNDYWLVESEFLKPVIKSPRESETIQINPNELNFKLIVCHKDKKDLEKTYLFDYIEWGEKEKFNKRPSTSNRTRWWDLGIRENCLFIVPCSFNDSFKVFENNNVLVDKRMYEGYCDYKTILIVLNSFLFPLMMELGSRVGLGEGLLDVTVEEVQKIKIVDPSLIRNNISLPKRRIGSVFEEVNIDPRRPIREQEPKPLEDRKALDDAVFDILGLTEEERKEVYWSVCELVKNRLEKAKSL